MAKNIKELDVTLEGKMQSRLMLKEYDKAYTNLPNSNLPDLVRKELEVVFKALTGLDELPLTDSTFTVSAKEVKGEERYEFNRIFSPTVFLQPADKEVAKPYLYVQWGSYEIKLQVDADGTISTIDSGLVLKLRNKKLNGYDTPCLLSTVRANGMTLSMPFPIRLASLETETDELELLLEANADAFMAAVGSKSSGGGSYKSFDGHTVKAGQLPLGDYSIVDCRTYEHPTYGVRYYLQSEAPTVPFDAEIGIKDEDGNWHNEVVTINGRFQIRSNSAIKKYMDAEPIVAADSPATLVVHEKGEYNGNPTSKVVMRFAALASDADDLDLNF